MTKYLLFLSLLLSPVAKAELGPDWSPLAMDKAAHTGYSYIINTITYGIGSRYLGMSRNDALVLSVATTMAIGFLKERRDSVFDPHDLFFDAVGTGLSSVTIVVFNF